MTPSIVRPPSTHAQGVCKRNGIENTQKLLGVTQRVSSALSGATAVTSEASGSGRVSPTKERPEVLPTLSPAPAPTPPVPVPTLLEEFVAPPPFPLANPLPVPTLLPVPVPTPLEAFVPPAPFPLANPVPLPTPGPDPAATPAPAPAPLAPLLLPVDCDPPELERPELEPPELEPPECEPPPLEPPECEPPEPPLPATSCRLRSVASLAPRACETARGIGAA